MAEVDAQRRLGRGGSSASPEIVAAHIPWLDGRQEPPWSSLRNAPEAVPTSTEEAPGSTVKTASAGSPVLTALQVRPRSRLRNGVSAEIAHTAPRLPGWTARAVVKPSTPPSIEVHFSPPSSLRKTISPGITFEMAA